MAKILFSEEQKEKILQAYDNGKSLKYCSNLVGCSQGTIRKLLVANNRTIRPYVTNKQKACKEKIKNKGYFSVQSHNMAWLMGFIAADGTIAKNKNRIKIGLSAKDEEILEKIKKELQLKDQNIGHYTTNKGFDVVELGWTCEQHKKDLSEYGIIPEKTFNLGVPTKLNKEYIPDYIRGYFDGDGSVSISQKSLSFSICGGTKEILEFIIIFLEQEYNIPKVNISFDNRTNHTNYYFNYSTNATKQLYEILYKNNSSLYLKRKKDKFEKCIKEYLL